MNARQKKKRAKTKIGHMKPGDILFCEFDLDKFDDDAINYLVKVYSEITPKECSVVAVPKQLTTKVFDKKTAIEYVSKTLEYIKKI